MECEYLGYKNIWGVSIWSIKYGGYKNMECELSSVGAEIDNHSQLNEFNPPVCSTLFIVMYCIS